MVVDKKKAAGILGGLTLVGTAVALTVAKAKAKPPEPTPENFSDRIAKATTLDELEDIRFGDNGFETAYSEGLIDYATYLEIYKAYVDRYNELVTAAPTPAPTPENFLDRISKAATLEELDEIRYGANGFETAYFNGQIDYETYLAIYDAYVKRYRELIVTPAPAYELTLDVSPSEAVTGEPIKITATLTLNGQPVVGELIRLYFNNQTIGDLRTDSNGTAVFTTHFDVAGTYEIRVTYMKEWKTASTTITVTTAPPPEFKAGWFTVTPDRDIVAGDTLTLKGLDWFPNKTIKLELINEALQTLYTWRFPVKPDGTWEIAITWLSRWGIGPFWFQASYEEKPELEYLATITVIG